MAGAASLRRTWSAVGHVGYFSIPQATLQNVSLSPGSGSADNPS